MRLDITAISASLRERAGQVDALQALLAELGLGVARTSDHGRLGRFEIRGEIGRGGMGRVMEAYDPLLDRLVAIKTLLAPEDVDEADLRAFVEEARVTARLQHPNVVPVHEIGLTDGGELFFVMKRVHGRSLRDVLAAGDAEREALLHGMVLVAQGVAAAHHAGVVHRDLKPANIMVGAFSEFLVMDWGMSGLRDGVAGTPGYMAPEVTFGAPPDACSDVWSLGATLFEVLCGESFADFDAPFLAREEVGQRDPRSRQAEVDDDLAGLCIDSLDADPSGRPPDASAFADRLQACLDGRRRRERAAAEVGRAAEAWEAYRALTARERDLRQRLVALRAEVHGWLPRSDPRKAELLAVEDEAESRRAEAARRFTEIFAFSERALSHDPSHAPARRLLTSACWDALSRARARGADEETALYRSRIEAYGSEHDRLQLQDQATVTVTSRPEAGAWLAPVDRAGLVSRVRAPQRSGTTPLECTLPGGSWLLTLRAPGCDEVRVPVCTTAGTRYEVHLPTTGSLGDDDVYVPAGPAWLGGDAKAARAGPRRIVHVDAFVIRRFPVTVGEYQAFLAALDPEQAWDRVPRQEGASRGDGRFWPRDVRWRGPVRDADGDEWAVDWPICGVSWHDAVAYTEWYAAHVGLPWRLPLEDEWEKAARGADGRAYPWGDRFDPTLCKMVDSRPGAARPEPVGSMPDDVSIFGVRDLAGGVREWAGDGHFNGSTALRPIRGGGWSTTSRLCRCANRFGLEPHATRTHLGFRLARAPSLE